MLLQTESGPPALAAKGTKPLTGLLVRTLLRVAAANFNLRPALRQYLRSDTGWIDFTVSIRTETDSARATISFRRGRAAVSKKLGKPADIELIFASDKALRRLLGATPTQQIFMFMKGDLRTVGNNTYMGLFFFLLSLLLYKKQTKSMAREKQIQTRELREQSPEPKTELSDAVRSRKKARLRAEDIDPGVGFLDDPYLSALGIEDFPGSRPFSTVTSRPRRRFVRNVPV